MPGGDGEATNVKAWKATHFRSEDRKPTAVETLHMRTVTGKGSLEDPVSAENSLRAEQSNSFEQVLGNSIATSEERLEQLRRVGCRATRRRATALCQAQEGEASGCRRRLGVGARRGKRNHSMGLGTV